MDGLQVCQLIVVGVHANAEEQTRIAAVHDLVVPELTRKNESWQFEVAYMGGNAPRRSSTGTSGPAAQLADAPLLADGPSARPVR